MKHRRTTSWIAGSTAWLTAVGAAVGAAVGGGVGVAVGQPASTPSSNPANTPANDPAAAPPIVGGPAEPPVSEAAPETFQTVSADVPAFVAKQIARLALMNLRLVPVPSADDYRLAGRTFELAETISPSNQDIVRRVVECAWSAGDRDWAVEATRRLVKLDPTDTVAQLRLIAENIAARQTVEERQSVYERLLGSAGVKLDPTIRSRLALDAALLARERGDESAYKRYLKQAVALDSTNKEAALLVYSDLVESGQDDRVARIELLANLLLADPLDPLIHFRLANELAGAGAFAQAERFHRNALKAMLSAGGNPGEGSEVESLVLEWQVKGPKAVVDRLNQKLASERDSIRRYNERLNQGFGLGQDIGKPEDHRLGFETDKVRAAAAWAAQDADTMKTSVTEMNQSVEFMFKYVEDDTLRPIDMSRAQANEIAMGNLLDAQYWRAVTGVDADKVEEQLARFEGSIGADQPGPELIRALIKTAEGKPAEALTALDKVLAALEPDSIVVATVWFGKAQAYEAMGERENALEFYRKASRQVPLTPVGAMARFRIATLEDRDTPLSPDRDAVDAKAKAIPEWVDLMIDEPQSFMLLSASVDPDQPLIGDRVLTIRVQNMSNVLLAMGSDRPINSRMLVAPSLSAARPQLLADVQPEVFELNRRLRLDRNEALTVAVRPEIGITGLLAELGCSDAVRLEWRVIQGFVANPQGIMFPCAQCLRTSTRTVPLRSIVPATVKAESLASWVATEEGGRFVQAAMGARRKLWEEHVGLYETSPNHPEASETARSARSAERAVVAQALASRYPSLPVPLRAMLVAGMPHAGQVPEAAPLDDAVRGETESSVLRLVLATRVADAKDPLLEHALVSEDPGLAAYAQLVKARLESDAPAWASLGPGLSPMRGVAPSAINTPPGGRP